MQIVTREEIRTAVRALGIEPGMGVMVHSAVQYLGKPENGLDTYLLGLDDVIRFLPTDSPQQGTLAVPAFNFAFARGEAYDAQQAPAQGMGVFSEYVRAHALAHRTPHPLQSMALIGREAELIAGLDTPGAFDAGSAFEKILELDYRLLLLGADVQAVSMVHYAEQRAGVPYRYWKEFSGKVLDPASGEWVPRTCRMFVRDLDLDPQLVLRPIQINLEKSGAWRNIPMHYGVLSACRLQDFVTAAEAILRADPWALVRGGNPAHRDDASGTV